MEVEQWIEIARQWDQMPEYVIWDTSEPLWVFGAQLCAWPNASSFIAKLVPLMVDFVTEPKRAQESFVEYLELLWGENDGLASGYPFTYVLHICTALGLELLGRARFDGLALHGLVLYRYWDMIGRDIRLRRLTMYELEELADLLAEESEYVHE